MINIARNGQYGSVTYYNVSQKLIKTKSSKKCYNW